MSKPYLIRARIALTLSLILIGFCGPNQAAAQSDFGIVVIDTQRIYREATAVMGLQQHIEGQRTAYQSELRKKEEALRKARQDLEQQRTVLASEVFDSRRRAFEEQVVTLQREVQANKRGLERLFARGMNQIRQFLVEISQEIAKERKVEMVVEKSAIVLVKPELEITQEALDRLNQRLPEFDLSTLQN